jgi:hypothetical protein
MSTIHAGTREVAVVPTRAGRHAAPEPTGTPYFRSGSREGVPAADTAVGTPGVCALVRQYDPSGVSHTGLVAWVVCWPNGAVSLRWGTGRPPAGYHKPVCQTETFESRDDLLAVHGHNGASVLVPVPPCPQAPPVFAFGAAQLAAWGVQWADRRATTVAVHSDHTREITEWSTVEAAQHQRWRGYRVIWLHPRE